MELRQCILILIQHAPQPGCGSDDGAGTHPTTVNSMCVSGGQTDRREGGREGGVIQRYRFGEVRKLVDSCQIHRALAQQACETSETSSL